MRKKSGCRKLAFVPLKADGKTYDIKEIIDLRGLLEQLDYKANYKEGSNFADNVQNIFRKSLQSYDLTVALTQLGLEDKGYILGKKYKDGGLATSTEDQAVPGALLFEETYDDDSFERVVLYNTTLYDGDATRQTDSDSYNYQQQGLTGKALPFENDSTNNKKLVEYRMDSSDSKLDKTKFNAWYSEIQYPAVDTAVTTVELAYTATGTVSAISELQITYNSESNKFVVPSTFKGNFTFNDGDDEKTATYSSSTKTWTIA